VDLKSTMVMRDYCVKTQILRDIGGYNVENSLFEDYELILKIAKSISFYYTDSTGTAYRNSVIGLSKKPREILVKKKNEIINKQIKSEPLKKRIKIKCERSVISFLKKIYRIFKR
jgi:phage anti-repressor protein